MSCSIKQETYPCQVKFIPNQTQQNKKGGKDHMKMLHFSLLNKSLQRGNFDCLNLHI